MNVPFSSSDIFQIRPKGRDRFPKPARTHANYQNCQKSSSRRNFVCVVGTAQRTCTVHHTTVLVQHMHTTAHHSTAWAGGPGVGTCTFHLFHQQKKARKSLSRSDLRAQSNAFSFDLNQIHRFISVRIVLSNFPGLAGMSFVSRAPTIGLTSREGQPGLHLG